MPGFVAGVIAVEPDGPPFASAGVPGGANGSQLHTAGHITPPSEFPCGIAELPLTYNPPIPFNDYRHRQSLFSLVLKRGATGRGESYLQDDTPPIWDTDDPFTVPRANPIRKLTNLSRISHALVTTEASRHSTFDWATVDFLLQAGVNVQWLELAKHGMHGNGHLCFLEKNSNDIAKLLSAWIQKHVMCSRSSTSRESLQVALPQQFNSGRSSILPGSLEPDSSGQEVTDVTDGASSPCNASNTKVSQTLASKHEDRVSQIPTFKHLNRNYHKSISRTMATPQSLQTVTASNQSLQVSSQQSRSQKAHSSDTHHLQTLRRPDFQQFNTFSPAVLTPSLDPARFPAFGTNSYLNFGQQSQFNQFQFGHMQLNQTQTDPVQVDPVQFNQAYGGMGGLVDYGGHGGLGMFTIGACPVHSAGNAVANFPGYHQPSSLNGYGPQSGGVVDQGNPSYPWSAGNMQFAYPLGTGSDGGPYHNQYSQ